MAPADAGTGVTGLPGRARPNAPTTNLGAWKPSSLAARYPAATDRAKGVLLKGGARLVEFRQNPRLAAWGRRRMRCRVRAKLGPALRMPTDAGAGIQRLAKAGSLQRPQKASTPEAFHQSTPRLARSVGPGKSVEAGGRAFPSRRLGRMYASADCVPGVRCSALGAP